MGSSKRTLSCICLFSVTVSIRAFNAHIMMPTVTKSIYSPSHPRQIFCSQRREATESVLNSDDIHSLTNTTGLRRKRKSSKEAPSLLAESVPSNLINKAESTVKTPKALKLDPLYWKDIRDSITIEHPQLSNLSNYSFTVDDDAVNAYLLNGNIEGHVLKKRIQFQVHGNPLPLRRHRTAHGFMYNPSAAAQRMFREVVISMLPSSLIPFEENTDYSRNHSPIDTMSPDDHTIISPFYQAEEYLSVHIIFYMRRPKTHFVAGNPQSGRIRQIYKGLIPRRSKTDVDNLAKFVLDSLNGLLYVDDKQIISLHVTKLLHSDGDFQGLTQICMENVHESHVKSFLDRYHQFHPGKFT